LFASSIWSTFTIEIWSKIYRSTLTFLDPFSSTYSTLTTRTQFNIFIADPTFTYPFPCSTCTTLTSRTIFCKSSSSCCTLTLGIWGFIQFINKIALGMKSSKNFYSSSFTLFGRENTLWLLKCFRKEVEMKEGLCWNLLPWVFGGKCHFGVLVIYYGVRSKGHILLLFNNYWHVCALECWKGFYRLMDCCMPLNVTHHPP
jgi:hypothetical protein